MTLRELIALYRAQARDESTAIGGDGSDMLCSDELLTIYANEAQDEACRRAQLLRDAMSPLCTVAYAVGDAAIALDARIVQVLRAFVDGWPVDVLGEQQMNAFMPTWMAASAPAPRPTALVAGVTDGYLHLWPVPSQTGQIKLQVQRLPLKPMRLETADTDRPEIRPELHRSLVHWMLYRAYNRGDTELFNDGKAAVHLAQFEAEFGRKSSGRNEEWVRRGAEMMPGPIA